ncbi:MAG: HD domain-containing protein, partial [Deltaproteobacteria bacterium]|nr:HD domain-containing protein [Deltaproteobacteria bacterium]
ADISNAQSFSERLAIIHRAMTERCYGVGRVSVALYDSGTKRLKTFASSPAKESPLTNYEALLEDSVSLTEIVVTGRARIIDDMQAHIVNPKEHTKAICGHGFASSYTWPMLQNGVLVGFVFFDSVHKGYFRDRILEHVDIFAQFVTEVLLNDQFVVRTLTAALRTAIGLVHIRDPETGNHLERMAHYSRMIAKELVHRGYSDLDDEQIEQIFNFAPLHDIGKIGIPDHILLKPGKLNDTEREVMSAHTLIGRYFVDEFITNFRFERIPYIDFLRNIAEQHHESVNGTGYPNALRGHQIALEAKIVAVSDVFDALTSARPYKMPWSNQHAFTMMKLMAIDRLDNNCVAALISCEKDLEQIQKDFSEPGHLQ